jgi:hypothetical protein
MDCSRRLEAVIAKPGNRICADCNAKNPRWVSINLGVFVCMRCCGQHRKLGVHISKMKSVTLDRWTPEMVRVIEPLDNEIVNAYWEMNLTSPKPTEAASAHVVEGFIKSKYEHRSWADRSRNDPASLVMAGSFTKAPQAKPELPRAEVVQAKPATPSVSALVDLLADDPPVTSYVHSAPPFSHSHSAPPVPHSHFETHDIWQSSFPLESNPQTSVTLASVQFVPDFPAPTQDPSVTRQENIARVMSMYQSHQPQPQQSQQFQPLGAIAAQSMMQPGYGCYGGSQWPSF